MRLRAFARSKRIVPARSPSTSIDEDAERVRLGLRALDLREDLVALLRAHRGEERLDVLVGHELDEEVGVVRPSHAESRRSRRFLLHPRADEPLARREQRRPTRISASPPSAAAVTGSSSRTAPYTTAKPGMR